MATTKSPADSQVEMRELVLPTDTNTHGNALGGRVLHLMDIFWNDASDWNLGFRGGRYTRARKARRWSRAKVKWDGFNSGLSAKCRSNDVERYTNTAPMPDDMGGVLGCASGDRQLRTPTAADSVAA